VYLKHFGFKRKPFVPVPDARELFQTRGHQEARSRLKIALHDRVPSLLLGESGVGKSGAPISSQSPPPRGNATEIGASGPSSKQA
jgi:type II secretory pathway predicted ATPase ExeA